MQYDMYPLTTVCIGISSKTTVRSEYVLLKATNVRWCLQLSNESTYYDLLDSEGAIGTPAGPGGRHEAALSLGTHCPTVTGAAWP